MSSATTSKIPRVQKNTGAIMKAATQLETAEVINQLLESAPVPDDDPKDDTLVPITPQRIQPLIAQPQPDTHPLPLKNEGDTNVKPMLLPWVIGMAIKLETSASSKEESKDPDEASMSTKKIAVPQKKVFKTVKYKLKRKYVKPRKFPCVHCNESYCSHQ